MASFLDWTPPAGGSHPRNWISNVNGPTLAEVIANRNAQGTGSGTPWANLVSYEAGKRSAAMSYYGLMEYGLSHAAVWLLGEGVVSSSERLNAGNRAVTVMLGIGANYAASFPVPDPYGSTTRERMMTLGMMYDWMYNFAGFSAADKATVRTYIVRFVAGFLRCSSVTDDTPAMVLTEFLWGHATEDACVAVVALAAILGDGTSEENTRWQGWMDYLLDMMDDGNNTRMFPCYRYFSRNMSDTEDTGGTYKGSGDYSYVTKREEAMNRMFPVMASALGMTTIWEDEGWYQAWMHWIFWHFRSDFHSHMQGECFQDAYFSHLTECHAMQVAQRNPSAALGKACQWIRQTYFRNQMPGGTYSIWGPYYIWVILWEKTSVIQTPPFLDAMNGGWQSRNFDRLAKVCFRTGWGSRVNSDPAHADYNKLDQKYSSATLCIPRFFLGVHQIRDAGHFDFCVEGKPLAIKTGFYDGVQTLEYKYDTAISAAGRNPTETQFDPLCWTRSGTTITLYLAGHGFTAGQSCTVAESTSTAALPNGSRTIQSVQTNSFTLTGLNAGATSGTCHVTVGGRNTDLGPITSDPTGHRKCFQSRVVAHNCVGIHSTLEESKLSGGGYYEHMYDDTLNFDATPAGFATFTAGYAAKDILNCGDQLWPKEPLERPIGENAPRDLADIVGASKKTQWCMEGAQAHFSRGKIGVEADNRQYAYAVCDLGGHYWSEKCTSYKRHFLWLGPGAVKTWDWPILVIWDDITCVPDATYGKKTCTWRLHTPKPYTGSASSIVLANGNSRGYLEVLLPVGVERTDVEGFIVDGVQTYAGQADVLGDFGHRRDGKHDLNRWPYAPTGGSIDNGDHRLELNPPTSTADVDFLVVLAGGTVPNTGAPPVELYTSGSDKGVTFFPDDITKTLTVLFAVGAPYGVTITEDLPPTAPTGLTATVVSQTRIDLDWATNPEGDISYYSLFRSKWNGTSWGAYDTPVTIGGGQSAYSDTGLDPGSTYRYYVTAVDDSDQESPPSEVVSATTPATPPVSATGAGTAPWTFGGKYSKYLLDRR